MGSWSNRLSRHGALRCAAVATAGAVVAGLLPGAAVPAAFAGPPAPAATMVAAAGSEAESASAQARRTGHRVELVGLRSQTGQVFADPSGTFTSEEYARPVRVRRADGSWVPVDLTLRRAADGSVVPAASPVDLRLSGGGSGPFATVTRDGRSVALGWRGRLPAPVLAGDTATYPDVLPGVDLRVRAEVDGFAEVLVVRDRAAAANPALRALRFTTATRGVSMRSGAAGSLSAVDSSGSTVLSSGTAMTWDSSAGGGRRSPMGVSLSPGGLTVTPDRRLLSDPDTAFPVYVDPSVTVGAYYWTMINQRFPNQSYWSYDRNSGAKVGYAEDYYDGWERYRSIFLYSTSSFAHKHILGATFSAYLTHSWSCTSSRTDLYLVSDANSGSTWNNNVGYWGSDLANVSNQDCNDSRIYTEWGSSALTSTVQTASNSWTNLFLGLRAYDESTIDAGWKKFDPSTAKLSVTYNTPPNTPTDLTADGKACVTGASRPFVGTATPTLRDYVTDPDGGLLNVYYAWTPILADGSYQSPWPSDDQPDVASGSTSQYTVPGLADGSYAWRSQSSDGTDSSPVTGWCEFTVDTLRPAALPTVASADGVYLADGNFHGGVGRTGSFTLGANGIGDVRSYLYGLADPPTTKVRADTLGGTATVSVTPSAAGLTTLYVRSVDRAGNLSDVRRYTFLTGSATAPVAHWRMDDGTGTTLADSSGHGNSAMLAGGATWTGGRVGVGGSDRAVTFDGTSGYAATAGPVVHTDRSYTVAAWARLTSTAGWASIAAQDGTQVSPFYLEYLRDDHRWAFGVTTADTANNGAPMVMAQSDAQVGVWTHLVGVYDAGAKQARLYVDGVLQGSLTTTTVWDAAGAFQIGRYMWPDGTETSYFPGDLDDVRVWDRVVFGDEISRIVNGGVLVGEWGLDDGTGTTATDVSGDDHPAALTPGAGWGDGHDGLGGLVLDGVSGSAATAGPVVHTDQSFTVAAWVRLTTTGNYFTAVSQDGLHSSSFYLQYRPDTNRWAFIMRNADTDTAWSTQANSTTVPQLNTWTHLVGEYDAGAGQLRLYVDGQLERATAFTTAWDAAGPLAIGRAMTGSSLVDYFPGEIDDVRVYAGLLTDQQIAALANQ